MDITNKDMYGVASVVFLVVAVGMWLHITKPKSKNNNMERRTKK